MTDEANQYAQPLIPPEEIPDEDDLYYRIHVSFILDRDEAGEAEVPPGAFRDRDPDALTPFRRPGTSTNWSKYSCPKSAQKETKNWLVAMRVGNLRVHCEVAHTPYPTRCHCDVYGDKKAGNPKLRVHLARLSRWVLKGEAPNIS